MTLYFIGLGVGDEKDITLKGIETIKQCTVVYLETYTSVFKPTLKTLEQFYCKKIIPADRDIVENKAEQTILKDAQTNNVAFLVVGDPLAATTHTDLFLRAKKTGISVEIIHNASIFTAVTETGLQLYKFGPTTSIPFANKETLPETPYNTIKDNLSRGLHTLVLFDLKPTEKMFMNIKTGISYLELIEKKLKGNVLTADKKIIGCAALGTNETEIFYGTEEQLKQHNFTKIPQCIIIPGKLHFMEEEFLEQFSL
ncbi:diphthine synthase [Candidatus Woesearchaeota archaeon]|nr:diphthine synthase [Candidatus Woesearchaeota archaeon]